MRELSILRLTVLPNKSPEPTAVGAVSASASGFCDSGVIGRRWLSFWTLGA
jgi:hypothetical protein